jgi:hypothetical protein
MRKEGLWKNPAKAIRSLPLSNWRSLLAALSGKLVIIENEQKGDFFIGPVVDCSSRAAAIHCFDGCGKWQEIERVPYRAITSVEFGNRYIRVHGRHLSSF